MKRILILALAAAIVLASCGKKESPAPVQAEDTHEAASLPDGKETETYAEAEDTQIHWDYTVLEDGTLSVWGYETENVPEIMEVPSEIDGHTVSEIDSLFTAEDRIRKVILPETVVSIGPHAFAGSISIEEVVFGGVIENISSKAFYECFGLKHLRFPEGLKNIGEVGIFMNKGLEELHVPASVDMTVEELGHAVFLTDETTIYAPAGSVWEEYAASVGYKFAAE